MKKVSYILLLILLVTIPLNAQQAKYVFYFIGDGMGLNQINATEMYIAEQECRIGVQPLLFTTFPVMSTATTFSNSNSITDSAAGGTALAIGQKSYNGAIGVDANKNPVPSVAERAKNSGKRVGIATSVSVNHATPAAFYAHQPKRNMYDEIALDLYKANFDFYAGSGFLNPKITSNKKEAPDIFPIFEKAGYTIARGLDEFKTKSNDNDKLILIQKEDADPSCIPYAIDRQQNDLTLTQITESAISFLSKNNKKGFFLMVEGGKIDWSCHNNDGATTFEEIIDFDKAIRVAYEFYKTHPKETLIVVTADHETGGLGMGIGSYRLNLKALIQQMQSIDSLSHSITDLRRMNNAVHWDDVKSILQTQMGFWDKLPLTWNQEKLLRDAFEESFVKRNIVFKKNLYSKLDPIAVAARDVMNEQARLGWTTNGHSAAYVPVFAIGTGSQLFIGKMDNTEIPQKIAKAAGYK